MFSQMQDPGVANRLTQQYYNDKTQAAAHYRLARTLRATPEPAAATSVRERPQSARALRALRPSLR
jgi:hypothetical protein